MRYEKPDVLEIGKAEKAILGLKWAFPLESSGWPRIFNPMTDHVDLDLVMKESESKAGPS
jgi:hypothetical protein